ncbi:hypothetical protein U1Q18_021881 [Sarracenia purpurea var. burkii]
MQRVTQIDRERLRMDLIEFFARCEVKGGGEQRGFSLSLDGDGDFSLVISQPLVSASFPVLPKAIQQRMATARPSMREAMEVKQLVVQKLWFQSHF